MKLLFRLSGAKNEKSLKAVLDFLENNKLTATRDKELSVGISSKVKGFDLTAQMARAIKNGVNEKTIIRNDRFETNTFTKHGVNADNRKSGDRSINVMQSIAFGQNEKSIIKQNREHYSTIHPTQKPPRLLERLLALVTKEGDVVLDPFSGSGSTAIACINSGRKYVGFEIDVEYYNSSIERVEKHLKTVDRQLKLAI